MVWPRAVRAQGLVCAGPAAGGVAGGGAARRGVMRGGKAGRARTILLVEQKMDVIRSLADRIIVLHNGELVADGDPQTVIASPVVQEAYLGMEPADA